MISLTAFKSVYVCSNVSMLSVESMGVILQRFSLFRELLSDDVCKKMSIQMHDDDIKLANCSARVGLSLKGIKPDEVGRGDIITSDESLLVKSEIEIDSLLALACWMTLVALRHHQ